MPLLVNPVFADTMQAYGEGGQRALRLGALEKLARLYWYTVEFGLIADAAARGAPAGLRILGSGIVSSKGESEYCLDHPGPNRLRFDLDARPLASLTANSRRCANWPQGPPVRADIDAFQETYFVIESFEQLFAATRADFTGYYEALAALPELAAGAVLPTDRVVHRGAGRKRRGITGRARVA